MKKIFLIIFLTVLSFFAFNLYTVYAEEVENNQEENKEIVQEEEQTILETPVVAVEGTILTAGEDETPVVAVEGTILTAGEDETPKGEDENENEGENEAPGESNPTTPPATGDGNNNEDDETPDSEDENISGGVVYDIQKVKVNILKYYTDEETGKKIPLAGAVLQLFDSSNNPIIEWTSTTEAYEILLPDGTYTLREKEAPEGFDIAEDKTFTVEVKIAEVDAGSDASATPCPHYYGTQMYYVEIEGVKHEVYCINQNWETPDENSQYDGGLLSSGTIRDYTKQTVPVGLQEDDPTKVIMSDGPIDVSDQSLTDQQLYDKILDIIYHRHTAVKALGDLGYTYSTEEIRFITEVALKNYTNPGLTERQYNVTATDALISAFDAAGVIYKIYYVGTTKKVSYLKHNYRDYVYTPDVPLGQNIVATDYGNGNSFGQMVAGHWNSYSNKNYLHPDADPATQAHNAKNNQDERDTVARYYTLFQYLISNDNPHPDDMNLYIYSSATVPEDLSGNNNDAKYQNLLGVTGYFEDIPQQELDVEIENTYSTKTREISVKKVWKDGNNKNNTRPDDITINLYANKELKETVKLNESNNWEYTFKDLLVYNKAVEIQYEINEVSVPNYVTEKEGDIEIGFTFTNTLQKDIEVTKIWKDANNKKNTRPNEITVNLLANNKPIKTITLDESNKWYYKFEGLDVFDGDNEIKYEIEEINVPDYKTEINEFIITNTLQKDIEVTKIWKDADNKKNTRPNEIEVTLYADNEPYKTVKLNESNKWYYKFEGLDVFDGDDEIDYTVNEIEVPNYKSETSGDVEIGFTFTNTLQRDIEVTKIWKDGNNKNNTRPTEITINLLADGKTIKTITLNESNKWYYKFEGLDVFDGNNEIKYEIEEINVSNYKTEINEFTITNTLQRTIKVSKLWDDKDDFNKLRPTSVTINLLANEEPIDTVILDESNEWKYEFKELDVFDEDGNEINYTVTEEIVHEYDTDILGDMENGFVVRNTYYGEGDDVPPTGDNIYIYVIMLITSLIVLIKSLKVRFN